MPTYSSSEDFSKKDKAKRHFLDGICALVVTSATGVQAGHHEGKGEKRGGVIGTVFRDEGWP